MWPHERSLVRDLKARPFVLLGVSTNGFTAAQLKDAMTRDDLPWRSWVDPGPAGRGPIATRWNLTNLPTLYLIDHRGVIRHRWVGAPDAKLVDGAIERWLREAEAK